jgi:hypothetical protein
MFEHKDDEKYVGIQLKQLIDDVIISEIDANIRETTKNNTILKEVLFDLIKR